MASDVKLLIFSPELRCIVACRWIGMSATIERARHVLRRPPDHSASGEECWGHVTAEEAAMIAETHIVDGIDPAGVRSLAAQFDPATYWWMIDHDH